MVPSGTELPSLSHTVHLLVMVALSQTRTQELRRKKDIEFEMVSNPVDGWPGKVC